MRSGLVRFPWLNRNANLADCYLDYRDKSAYFRWFGAFLSKLFLSKTKGFCKYSNNRKSFVVIYTYLSLAR